MISAAGRAGVTVLCPSALFPSAAAFVSIGVARTCRTLPIPNPTTNPRAAPAAKRIDDRFMAVLLTFLPQNDIHRIKHPIVRPTESSRRNQADGLNSFAVWPAAQWPPTRTPAYW